MNPYEIDIKRQFSSNINFDKKILFIHIPKCCGNFIKKSIGGFKGDSHLRCSDLPDGLFEKMFSLSFVRNPWSRTLSAYKFLMKGGSGSNYDLNSRNEYLMKHDSFSDFVEKGGLKAASLMQIHFLPQSYFLNKDIDYIGKCEDLKSEISMLPNIFGESFDLKSIKRSKNENYRSFYNLKTLKIVEDIYKEDVERFMYSF